MNEHTVIFLSYQQILLCDAFAEPVLRFSRLRIHLQQFLFFSLHPCTSLIYRLLSAHTDRTDLITAVLREPHASPVGLIVLCISEAIIKSPNFKPCPATSPPLNHNSDEKSFSLLRCSHSPHSYVIAFLRRLPKQSKPRLVFDLKQRLRLLRSLKSKAGTGTAFCNSAILSLK